MKNHLSNLLSHLTGHEVCCVCEQPTEDGTIFCEFDSCATDGEMCESCYEEHIDEEHSEEDEDD